MPRGQYERRKKANLKPIRAQFLADHHIPEDSDHATHLRLVFAASPRGFTWKEIT